MAERDEEMDLDLDSGGKALLGEAAVKKRAKAKPKAKTKASSSLFFREPLLLMAEEKCRCSCPKIKLVIRPSKF